MDQRNSEKRVEACRKTFPAHNQATVFALAPGKRPLSLETRHILFDRSPPRLFGVPHPFGDLRADPTSAEAPAEVFGVIALVGRQYLEPFARSAACARADAEGIQQREDLGALVPIGGRGARRQRHDRGIREAVDEDALAFPAISHPLTAAFAPWQRRR